MPTRRGHVLIRAIGVDRTDGSPLRFAMGQDGAEIIVRAVDEVVEGGGSENEIALKQEVPKDRNDQRYGESGDGEVDVAGKVEAVEPVCAIERIGQPFRAEGVEQHAADPYQEKLYAYGQIGALLHPEGELIVDDAVGDPSEKSAEKCRKRG